MNDNNIEIQGGCFQAVRLSVSLRPIESLHLRFPQHFRVCARTTSRHIRAYFEHTNLNVKH